MAPSQKIAKNLSICPNTPSSCACTARRIQMGFAQTAALGALVQAAVEIHREPLPVKTPTVKVRTVKHVTVKIILSKILL